MRSISILACVLFCVASAEAGKRSRSSCANGQCVDVQAPGVRVVEGNTHKYIPLQSDSYDGRPAPKPDLVEPWKVAPLDPSRRERLEKARATLQEMLRTESDPAKLTRTRNALRGVEEKLGDCSAFHCGCKAPNDASCTCGPNCACHAAHKAATRAVERRTVTTTETTATYERRERRGLFKGGFKLFRGKGKGGGCCG